MSKKMKPSKQKTIRNNLIQAHGLLTIVIIVFAVLFTIAETQAPSEFTKTVRSLLWGACVSQLIALVIQVIKGEKSSVCMYQAHLHELDELGICKLYENRGEGNKKSDYIVDLIDDLNSNHNGHKNDENPIKMIGVSLDYYFDKSHERNIGNQVAQKIEKMSKDTFFRVLICDENNQELIKKTDFAKNMGEDCITDIEKAIERIKLFSPDGRYIKLRKYDYAPYFTMIIVGLHIYYTPNNVFPKNFSFPFDEKREDYKDKAPHLSFQLKRHSAEGQKLEQLFDETWKQLEPVESTDKELVSMREV